MFPPTLTLSVIASLLLVLPVTASAIGLGEIQVDSALGKPLRASVSIIATTDELPDIACFRLLRKSSPADNEVPRLGQARLSISTIHGKHWLSITTDKPVNEPILSIPLHVGCNEDFTKEFTLLLDPPEFVAVPTAASTSVESKSIAKENSPSTVRHTGEWEMDEGESLKSLAKSIYPADRRMQRAFIDALREANPDAVPRKDKTPFAPGTMLRIPDLRTLANRIPLVATVPQTEPIIKTKPQAKAAPPIKATAKPTPALKLKPESVPRLQIVTAPLGSAPASKLESKLNDQQQALLAQSDDQTAAMMSQKNRITELEGQVAAMQQSLAGLQTQLTAANRKLAEKPNTPGVQITTQQLPVKPASSTEPFWWGVISTLGLLGFAMALHGWSKRRRQQEALEIAEDNPKPPFDMTFMPPMTAHLESSAQNITPAPAPITLAEAPAWSSPMATITVAEMDSALEQAEVYFALGRADQAISELKSYIDTHPHTENFPDLKTKPWRKLLEIYRTTGAYDEFEELARRYHKQFNIAKPDWRDASENLRPRSLEEFPRLISQIMASWGTLDCLNYLQGLIRENRGGKRAGFDPAVFDEIIALVGILEQQEDLK